MRLLTLAGVGLTSIAFFVYVLARVGGPDMAILYGELGMDDSGQMITKLESMGVPYELRAGGAQIFVPRDQLLRLRISMAQEGLPTGGSVGYEIFDKSEGFGASNFMNKINRLRALEGELARTIRTITPIKAARVHLVLPRRELFQRSRQEPSASITIKTHGGIQLEKSQILAIRHLIAAAVPGLKPGRISIIDDRGTLLARTADKDETGDLSANSADEMRRNYESRLVRTIEDLVERSVGPGNVRAQVTADMDFDRVTTNEEIFDPDSQVVRSTQVVEENKQSSDATLEQPVSVATNLPPAQAAQGDDATQRSSNRSSRSEETINYEISKTIKNHVRETGTVRRLSIAVLVDGTYTAGTNGQRSYQPRKQEELEQLTTLVRSAAGYNADRGDTVQVINMQFAIPEQPLSDADEPFLTLSKHDYMRIAEVAVLTILALLVLLLVIRPLMRRAFELAPAGAGGRAPMLGDQSRETAQLAGPAEPAVPRPAVPESMIDIDQIEGRVRASSLKKIGDLVDSHPEETIAILRNWMYEER